MVRRLVVERPEVEGMPAVLAEFRHEDWAHLVGPTPPWWSEARGSYVGFKARLMFGRARNYWRSAHGLGWWGRTEELRRRAAGRLRDYGIEVSP